MKEFVIISLSFVGLFLLIAAVYLFFLVRPKRARKSVDGNLLCKYAHRGLHGGGVAENSLEAFELAARSGCGIELDVQLSKDGKVMVFHDYTLLRMTGREEKFSELSAEELESLRLGGTDQCIPSFENVLRLVDGRVPILVELKGENFDTSLCPRVAEILKGYNGDFCIESFNPLLIKEIKKYLPSAFCGLLYTNVIRDKKKRSFLNVALSSMSLNFLARPNFIAYNKLDRDAFPVKLTTKFFGAVRFVWTVKGEEEINCAETLGECPIFEKE